VIGHDLQRPPVEVDVVHPGLHDAGTAQPGMQGTAMRQGSSLPAAEKPAKPPPTTTTD
jgi:hypothetical protein